MSIAIDNYGSELTDLYNTTNDKKTDELQNTLSKDYSSATDEELMDVCKEFESYFTEQVFKALQKMVPENEESSSTTSTLDYFKDTLYQEYAKSSTENGGLGLAQTLYESMKRNYNI